MPTHRWTRPPPTPTLPLDEVHVWRGALDWPSAALRELLTPEEMARAQRYRFERHRRRFVAARALLRLVLARYLDIGPAQVRLRYGPYGKPALLAPEGTGMQFNVAHTGDLALYAIAGGRSVGIDVERVRPVPDVDALVARYFAPGERERFRALAPEERLRGFLAGWTRKEAYMKARGEGLAIPLNAFEVNLAPAAPARLIHDRRHPTAPAHWWLSDLDLGPEVVGAIAVARDAAPLPPARSLHPSTPEAALPPGLDFTTLPIAGARG